MATDALAQGNDSITRKWVDGNFYTEVGYRVTNWLLPFARYDLLTIAHEKNYKVSTVGLNAGPFHGVGIKLQLSQEGGNTRFDSSLSYSLSF